MLDLTGQLKLSPKGYVNGSLTKVSALEACTVVFEQQIKLSHNKTFASESTAYPASFAAVVPPKLKLWLSRALLKKKLSRRCSENVSLA